MVVVALAIQQLDGVNIFLLTKSYLSMSHGISISQAFASKIVKIRKADFARTSGPRTLEPHYRSGAFIVCHQYRVQYALLNEVYLLAFTHREDNPFESELSIKRTKSLLCSLCKGIDVTILHICKKITEIYFALEKILDGDDAVDLNQKISETSHSQDQSDAKIQSPMDIVNTRFNSDQKRLTSLYKPSFPLPNGVFKKRSSDKKDSTDFDQFGQGFINAPESAAIKGKTKKKPRKRREKDKVDKKSNGT